MKEAFQLAALCVCAATVLVVLRQARPEIATVFSLAAGAIILLALSDRLGESVQVIREVAKQADAGNGTETLLRVAGIGALCTLGGQLCRDAGEKGMGEKVELGGKIMMLSMALPMAASLLQAVCEMLL